MRKERAAKGERTTGIGQRNLRRMSLDHVEKEEALARTRARSCVCVSAGGRGRR